MISKKYIINIFPVITIKFGKYSASTINLELKLSSYSLQFQDKHQICEALQANLDCKGFGGMI